MAAAPSLDEALARLEALRPTLGDAAVDAAIAALRRGPGAPAPAPERRLRQVSVLFVEIDDPIALLAAHGEVQTQALVARALADFGAEVRAAGGEVLRDRGDALKAVFGGRRARENEAEHAVNAGLRIVAAARGQAFGVRVGIHTGPVLLGGGVEAERSAIGHTVNLAARLCQSAPVGRVRIGDSTWALVRGQVLADEQPPLQVKGHSQALRTWLVEALQAAGADPVSQAPAHPVGEAAPMVGRQSELDALQAWFAQTAARRRSACALVLADAGLGKTRLRGELLSALGLSDGDNSLLQARARTDGALQPYGLLRQMLARWLGIHDDLAAEAARQRLLEGLLPWLDAPAPAQAAAIGQLIGLDFGDHPAVVSLGAAALQARAFAALTTVLHRRAKATPLLLVLDDLHAADEASLGFVQSLLKEADAPLALLLLARPELLERPGPFRWPADALQLRLRPLPAAASRELAAALLARLAEPAPELEAMLAERAAGHPLYLQALVQMLIDDGVIDIRAPAWHLHADRLGALRVPPTLIGVLQARLDALPAAERIALHQASIVGPVFWQAALEAVDAQAGAALPALLRRGLIVERETSAFAHTAEYVFSHQLLHDTTYASVLKETRRSGHARAARWLAERVRERPAEFLAIAAEHYERAGDSDHALDFWDRAHADAMRRFANQAALAFAERALAQPALADTRWRFMLMSNRCAIFDRIGAAADAAAERAQMAALAEREDDAAMRADLASHRMLKADHDGQPHEARALAHEVLALAERAGPALASPSVALAQGELAWLAIQDHRYDEVNAHVAAGLVAARRAALLPRRQGGYAGYEQQLRAVALQALIAQERHAEALTAAVEAEAALGPRPRALDRINALQRRCDALRELGRVDEAAACAETLATLAEQTGVERLQLYASCLLAELGALRSEPAAAVDAALDRAERLARHADAGAGLAQVLELRARIAHARGDGSAAHGFFGEAAARLQAQGRDTAAALLLAERAPIELMRGDPAAARAAVEAALAHAAADPRPHRRMLRPGALRACAQVLRALGDGRAAELEADWWARRDEQLRSLADDDARRRLLEGVPHWRDPALGPGAPAAGRP